LKRLTKAKDLSIDNTLYTLHFLHLEQRLHEALKGKQLPVDPFAVSKGVAFATTFQTFRGLFRDSEKLRRFMRDTHTQATTKGVIVDMTIMPWVFRQEGGIESLERRLQRMGITKVARYQHVISALLPYGKIGDLTRIKAVRVLRAAQAKIGPTSRTHPHYGARPIVSSLAREPRAGREGRGGGPSAPSSKSGLVTSEGDKAMGTDIVRDTFAVNGSTLRCIGILSDSFNFLGRQEKLIASGDLPENIIVLQDIDEVLDMEEGVEPTDEGSGIAELIFDVVPGIPALAFHTAQGGQANFARGIERLTSESKCSVTVDDIIYSAEPFFATGIVGQAVNKVAAKGTAYYSAAGNTGTPGLFGRFNNVGRRTDVTLPDGSTVTYEFHRFKETGSIDLPFTLGPGVMSLFVLQWDQPHFTVFGPPGALTDLDILIYDRSRPLQLLFIGAETSFGADPVEVLPIINPFVSPLELNLRIGKYIPPKQAGTPPGPDPNLIALVDMANDAVLPTRSTSPTSFGHSNAQGASAVGASFYANTTNFGTAPPLVNDFSSRGSFPLVFRKNGSRIVPPIERQVVKFVGPDGANTRFFPSRSYLPDVDLDGDGNPNFSGTSASAPHVAALAALIREKDPSLTPRQIQMLLMETADDMNDPATPGFDVGIDEKTGAGFVNGPAAFRALSSRRAYPQEAELATSSLDYGRG